MQTIGVIGTGNMGGALIEGLLKSKQYKVLAYDLLSEKANAYKKSGAVVKETVAAVANEAAYMILTVKPSIYPRILSELADVKYNGCIITVAPGFTAAKAKELSKNDRVVRTMPNTPAMVGEGMTLIAACENESDLRAVEQIFSCVGKTAVLPETLLTPGVALSSSSPAFVYTFINALADGALSYGFSKEEAVKIAAQTVLGSAKMVLETGEHPSILKDKICSPGGTTIAATNTLDKCGFQAAIYKAMDACTKKAEELS